MFISTDESKRTKLQERGNVTKRAIVLIGIPGSGKSTYVEKNLHRVSKQRVVCPDDIRAELTGSVTNQKMNQEVFLLAYERAKLALRDNRVLIFDATNAQKHDRTSLLDYLRKQVGDEGWIEGIWFKTPLDECLANNLSRDRQVPEEAIKRMHRQLEHNPPHIKEGWNQLYLPTVSIARV